ncbi:22704_t:CDS:1, partial [Gigaspora rosea]
IFEGIILEDFYHHYGSIVRKLKDIDALLKYEVINNTSFLYGEFK